MTATCAVHFDEPSIATCSRCGRFCCASCMRTFTNCTECVARTQAELPPLEGRANYARYGLWATAGCHALMAVFAIAQLASGDVSSVFAILSALATAVYLPTYVITIVLVCRWFHLATRHGLARGGQLGVTPAQAVGSWFVPFVNFVTPFHLTRQLFVVTGKSHERVGWWQATWVLGNIVANVGTRLPDVAGVGGSLAADVLLIISAILGAKVIDELRFE